jgi:thiol-disulfide isomerase/thioredoxin
MVDGVGCFGQPNSYNESSLSREITQSAIRSTPFMNRWHIAFITLLITGPLWIWANRLPLAAQQARRTPQPALGYPAPDFQLTGLQAKPFVLAEQRGKPVVINFWATWCAPCQRELPALQATAERYAGQVQIIGIDQGETLATVQPYVQERGLTFPILLDEDLTVGQRYQIQGMPTTFFIDGDGVIRHLWVGEMNSITLAEGIAQILE